MKKTVIWNPLKAVMQVVLLLSISMFSLGTGGTNPAFAQASLNEDPADSAACGQLLVDAEAGFLATLAADGSVPASPEANEAALEYIRIAKLCYEEIEAQNSAGTLQGEMPTFIDDGAVMLDGEISNQFAVTGSKWGSSTPGTSGGTVTYSFMGNGLNLGNEPNSAAYGSSIALTSLPNFEACFITEIQTAFAAWQAAANIKFVQVSDNGGAFDATGATGDIRIGAHAFDGNSGILAHAYYAPPNGTSAAGDMHFDHAENWSCKDGGVDIGVVAMHEIGHSLGLNHEKTGTIAVMDPYYNSSLKALQTDDVNGIRTIYGPAEAALAPSNDDFDGATPIDNIAFLPPVYSVVTATADEDDPDPIGPCSTARGDRSIHGGGHTVWYKYKPTVTESISLDTNGSSYDTYMAVWTGSRGALSLVECNEDTFEMIQAELSFSATAGTWYYIEIGSFRGYSEDPIETSPAGNLDFNAYITNTDITVGGALMGKYYVPASSSMRRTYLGVNNGPAKVFNSASTTTIASQRVIFGGKSYSEMMGLPANQLTNEYWFPYYNNVAMDSQLRVSNLGGVPTTINVYLAGAKIDTYTLAAGAATRKNYLNKNSGPLRVTSSATNILSTIRVLFDKISYSEMMGLPANQLTNEYWFPYYNNVAMDSQLRVSNLGGVPTTINVYLAGTKIDTYTLAAGTAIRKNYPNKNSGPLRVTSSDTNILSTIRVLYSNKSFSELMGFPANQLAKEYWYPVYDNVVVDSQLRVSNVGVGPTTITVYLGGVQVDTYTLAKGAATRKNYVGKNDGPLYVVSTAEPILTTIRMLYTTPTFSSLYEMTGLAGTKLSTQYFFPWYNNFAMNSQLRFASP